MQVFVLHDAFLFWEKCPKTRVRFSVNILGNQVETIRQNLLVYSLSALGL